MMTNCLEHQLKSIKMKLDMFITSITNLSMRFEIWLSTHRSDRVLIETQITLL
jgi:hypothetical protein